MICWSQHLYQPADLGKMAVSGSCLNPFPRPAVLSLKPKATARRPGHLLSHRSHRLADSLGLSLCPRVHTSQSPSSSVCRAGPSPSPELSTDGLSHPASRNPHDLLMALKLCLECHEMLIPRLQPPRPHAKGRGSCMVKAFSTMSTVWCEMTEWEPQTERRRCRLSCIPLPPITC